MFKKVLRPKHVWRGAGGTVSSTIMWRHGVSTSCYRTALGEASVAMIRWVSFARYRCNELALSLSGLAINSLRGFALPRCSLLSSVSTRSSVGLSLPVVFAGLRAWWHCHTGLVAKEGACGTPWEAFAVCHSRNPGLDCGSQCHPPVHQESRSRKHRGCLFL